MASLSDIRKGLAERMHSITGLRTYAYMHPKPEVPAICISGPKVGTQYDDTFSGTWMPLFDVWLFVNPQDLVRAQQTLDTYLDNSGTKSLRAALDADSALGGLGVSCRFVGISQEPRLVDTAGAQLLGAAVSVEILSP